MRTAAGRSGGALARWAVALGLGALSFAAVMAAQRDQGVARDEVVYMTYGKKYAAWWGKLLAGRDVVNEAAITRHFGGARATANNREHPPLMKTLMGLSERLLHRELGWVDALSAQRAPSAAMNAILVALVFLFAAARWGPAAGGVAALLTLLLPRAFFHAGLAAFDAAMVTMWMATLFAYYQALRSLRWCVVLGVVFGLALATKHNALMLPGVMGAHYLWLGVRDEGVVRQPGVRGKLAALWRGLWQPRLAALVSCAVLGPLVLIAVWPWLWFDTAAHLGDWIRFHLHHVHYNYEYLGENWNAPPFPWHVPVVTTLLTVPVATVAAAACGALAMWRDARSGASRPGDARADGSRPGDAWDQRAPGVLLALSALVAMGPFLVGRAPIFGAEKHWAPAIPSLCLVAGVGVVAAAGWAARGVCAGLVSRAREPLVRGVAVAVIGAAVVAAALVETAMSRPYALTHYNALAGGAPGGADLGMNRQFWGYAARGVLPFLRRRAPAPGEANKPVYTHDASPAWGVYRSRGLVPATLPDAGREGAGVRRSQLAIVIHERHFNRHDYMIWEEYGTVQPVFVLRFQGVPIVSVYERPPQ